MFKLKRCTIPALLGLFCFLVYNANLRQIAAEDTLSARYLPFVLWHHGTLSFDADTRLVSHGHPTVPPWHRPEDADAKVSYFEPWAYWMVRTRGHQWASLYPVVAPLLVAPLYYPAVRWLDKQGWQQPEVDRVAELMEKLSASLLASLASVLMYLVLRRDCGRWSLPLALVFAFGTNTWMISSQALWQHGAAELLITLALLLVLAPASSLRTALLGAVSVLIAANRPPDALIAGGLALYTFWSRKRSALWLLAGAALPLAALLYYNIVFIGHYGGGYALPKRPKSFFHPGLAGLAGLFVSPTRGLLVFTPFLVFLPVGLMQRLRMSGSKGLAVVLSLAAVALVAVYSQVDWRAGYSWGPRWLTDLLPILMWLLAPALLVLRPVARGFAILAMVASVTVQTIGAFWYTKASDELIFAPDRAPMQAAWDLKNIPFLVELHHPPAHGGLLDDARGMLDLVGTALRPTSEEVLNLENGTVMEGWALTGGRTPAQLVALIDGIVLGATTEFLPRTDVNEALHTTALSGWRLYANLQGISPGKHVLQLAVRSAPGNDMRILREQRVIVIKHEEPAEIADAPAKPVTGPELETMATRSAALLREHQSSEGYWLTTHTQAPRYEAPQQEMNTYLTSVLVDLLSPVARDQGLDEAMEHARRHLAAQIESNGLVRYHGLPNGPAIGHLGCVITPDADDTALAWRIAGPGANDPRLKPMLEELARYRDSRGLYRTWLASPKDYQGLDPGHDPDPADICIQMHVYLMLRQLDPTAAEQLCRAIQRLIGNEEVWVYYNKTALIPYLRCAELRQMGCDLPLPTDRLAHPVAGQEIWSEAAQRFVEIMISPQDEKSRQAVRDLLVRLGRSDFALLRRTPPLLYHNDQTATVSRFYWSEDFGYALWLRLYEAAGLKSESPRKQSP